MFPPGSGTTWGTWQRAEGDDRASRFPRSQSDPASVGRAGTSPTRLGPRPPNIQDLMDPLPNPHRVSADGWTHTSIHLSLSLSLSMFHSLRPFFFCLFVSKNTAKQQVVTHLCVCVCVLSRGFCHTAGVTVTIDSQLVILVSARTINMSRYPLESQTLSGRLVLRCIVFPVCRWFLRWC